MLLKIKVILFFILLTSFAPIFAQHAVFIQKGNISFEKKINAYALLDQNMNAENVFSQAMADAYKKNNPQFKTTNFNLAFNKEVTLYEPLKNDDESSKDGYFEYFSSAAGKNIVYTDLAIRKTVSAKKVFEDNFLVTDSTRLIHWKITNETRDIAGFQCRRANAIIMDSIYVVAFYTNEIITSGGPESFNGLPGMILGVALPHEHITWFATKVTVSSPGETMTLVPPTKGKPVNNKEMYDKLQPSLKDWGKSGRQIIQNSML